MAKHRSPNYPAISLEEALELAQRIWNKEKRTSLSSQAAAIAMGYASLSGAVRPKISALKKYGLLEKSGKNWRLSELALDILHGTPEQKRAGIVSAIDSDPLFSMLLRDFPDASAATIRSELITRNNFSDDGADRCIKAFFNSKSLVENVQTENNEGPIEDNPKIEVGSFVQWAPKGEKQFETPRQVREISEDGNWVLVEGSKTGAPMSELTLEQPPANVQGQNRTNTSTDPFRLRDELNPDDGPTINFPLSDGASFKLVLTKRISKNDFERLKKIIDISEESLVQGQGTDQSPSD